MFSIIIILLLLLLFVFKCIIIYYHLCVKFKFNQKQAKIKYNNK